MITKVKCVTEGCELKDQVMTATALFFGKVAPLDGPFNCPKCGKTMKVVDRVPTNIKGNSGSKNPPYRIAAKPIAKKSTVGKKRKSKGTKIKISGRFLGYKKPPKKSGPKKPGPRKRS